MDNLAGASAMNAGDLEKQSLPIEQTSSVSFESKEEAPSPDSGDEDAEDSCSDGEVDLSDRGSHFGREDGPPSIVERVLSRVTSRSSVDPGPPPDGGWRAWGVCVAAHLIIANTWGFINSFGTFQTYYTGILDRPASDVSWIGSITVFLVFFIGTLTGRLSDAGFFRPIFIFGTILQIGGIFATSFCHSYWQFLLAQGLCMGIGSGCMFCPGLAVLSTYFAKKRALVLGIAACGSATGGLIFPSMVRQLLPEVGFPWTMRAIGFIQLGTLLIAHILIKPRIKPRKSGALVDWPAFKELEYTFYAVGAFFSFWGVYFPFYYLASFSRGALADPFSYESSLDLLIILNGIGIIGRVVPNYLADRVGAINLFIPVALSSSVIVFSWIAVHDKASLYVWACVYGLISAGVQGLFPAGIAFLTTDLRKAGVRMGMMFTIVSFAVLTGPPIEGAIIDSTGSYTGAQVFSGASLVVGAAFIFAAKVVKMRKTGAGWLDRV